MYNNDRHVQISALRFTVPTGAHETMSGLAVQVPAFEDPVSRSATAVTLSLFPGLASHIFLFNARRTSANDKPLRTQGRGDASSMRQDPGVLLNEIPPRAEILARRPV